MLRHGTYSLYAYVSGVLAEDEDVLVNVNMVDREKAEKNVELKKKKPDYKPYDEEESVDDMVMVSSLFRLTHHISVNQVEPFLH